MPVLSRQVNVRVPQRLRERLERYCAETERTLTQAVLDALREHLPETGRDFDAAEKRR